ncbi:MAG: hypothetical protein ACHQF2_04610 [Flavobacteriales bacterium]
MKKNFLYLNKNKIVIGLLAMVFVFAYSCRKESTLPLTEKKSPEAIEIPDYRTETEPEMVGRLHNEYLSDYYSQLSARVVAESGIENLTEAHFRNIVFAYINDSITGTGWDDTKTEMRDNFAAITNVANPEDAIERSITSIQNSTYGSSNFREYLVNMIQTASTLADNQIAGFIEDTKTDATGTFSGTELNIILASLETFESSVTYWTDHEDEWIELIDPNDEMNITSFPKSSIGSADMGGAAAGGTAGALLGGTATLGAATVPAWFAGAVIGGISNSIGQAVSELWDWLWG